MTKLEAAIAKFASTIEGKTNEQRALLKVFRNLPKEKQEQFFREFAAKEMARL